MSEPTRVVLSGGRRLAVDDVGDRHGRPVVFLHGSPSCRLARPPLDPAVADAGVRLLAFDRPGLGASDPDPETSAASFAADLAYALDQLEVERFDLVAWSAGAIWALAAGTHPALADALGRVTIAAGLVPAQAFHDAAVRTVTGTGRSAMLETVAEMGPRETAAMVAPMLVPYPCSFEAALEHLVAHRGPLENAEVASVPGGPEQSAQALVETLRQGLDGLIADLAVQLSPLDVDLAAVRAPVRLVYGDADSVCPPAFGRWLADRLPNPELEVLGGASHGLPYTHWLDLLSIEAG